MPWNRATALQVKGKEHKGTAVVAVVVVVAMSKLHSRFATKWPSVRPSGCAVLSSYI